jgi:hypothetical protein
MKIYHPSGKTGKKFRKTEINCRPSKSCPRSQKLQRHFDQITRVEIKFNLVSHPRWKLQQISRLRPHAESQVTDCWSQCLNFALGAFAPRGSSGLTFSGSGRAWASYFGLGLFVLKKLVNKSGLIWAWAQFTTKMKKSGLGGLRRAQARPTFICSQGWNWNLRG